MGFPHLLEAFTLGQWANKSQPLARSSHVPGYYEDGDKGAGFVASGAEDGKVGKPGFPQRKMAEKHTKTPYLFPTCQVRVVRFYQSCSPPPPPPLLLSLLLQFLLDHVCINFHVHFRLANSSPISSPTSVRSGHCWTSTARFWAQWAPLDLNLGPSELSGHRWTSTWDLPSAVGTAGPQPGTFRAQWAPLDLNLGPSELSGHRWTSTWDLPSAVGTTGPQPGTFRAQWAPLDLNLGPSELSGHRWTSTCDFRAQWAPLDLNGQIECQKICQIERQIECQIECQKICQINARRYAR